MEEHDEKMMPTTSIAESKWDSSRSPSDSKSPTRSDDDTCRVRSRLPSLSRNEASLVLISEFRRRRAFGRSDERVLTVRRPNIQPKFHARRLPAAASASTRTTEEKGICT
ncbi:hypothetical protein ACLOJK_005932 [Asimina triloba]